MKLTVYFDPQVLGVTQAQERHNGVMLLHPTIDPVALQLGPLAIHWYGLTYLAAFALFVGLA
ncbi:MAG: hypothetical protein RL295_1355, partial [Pseudomonadota bacterium]